MAIVKTNETSQELSVTVNNGDLEALKNIERQWKFKNKESVLRFALAIIVKALESGNKKIMIEENGKPTVLTPGDTLIRKENGNEITVS